MRQMQTVDVPRSSTSRASALADLYRREAGPARALAYLLTGDKQWAEDLVQDAFVRIGSRFIHLRRPDAFPNYLRRTIINLYFSQFRRLRIERASIRRVSSERPVQPSHTDVEQRDEILAALRTLPNDNMRRWSCVTAWTTRNRT
jgi:DNA-directed RNA polymerase specialized sigma24 family protein